MLFTHDYMAWCLVAALLALAPAPEEELHLARRLGSFSDAQAMAVDPAGTIYVVEGRERRIVRIAPTGEVLGTWGGYAWSGEGADRLLDLAAPNGIDVYAADYGNHRVLRFDRKLNFVSALSGEVEGESRRFGYVRSVAVSRLGSLYLVDGENDRVVQIEGNEVRRTIGGLDAGAGRLRKPRKVRTSSQDDIYVLEERGVVRYDVNGTFSGLLPFPERTRSLCTADSVLFVLDSCSVFRSGGRASPAPLGGLVCGNDSAGAVVDIAAVRDSLYVLTRHSVSVYVTKQY